MKRVITYGTYDLLHYGHIKLLERAKALGDYLIVGVTADDFDKTRGKINVQQSLVERIENVRNTGLADEIIIEEYEGQKIDDICRLNIDIFTVGSDWKGKFDYLNDYCKVVYLDRTLGVSSSDIRAELQDVRVGLVGETYVINKFAEESEYVNGVRIVGVCTRSRHVLSEKNQNLSLITDDYSVLLKEVDAVYILSHPREHYEQIKLALENGCHVLCESPLVVNVSQCEELYHLAIEKNCILIDGIKTAYSTAYNRMILLAKSGIVGEIVSVDSICTSLKKIDYHDSQLVEKTWNSLSAWGPTALLPIFQLLGPSYLQKQIVSRLGNTKHKYDEFTKVSFIYSNAVASIKVGKGVKSEGELIISGTKGYIYVPAPWWKTDYFEVRYENQESNKRYFYQLEGEGIRYEIVCFIKAIQNKYYNSYITSDITTAIVKVIDDYYHSSDIFYI